MHFYQVLSRKNDINGNPYRLVCLYAISPAEGLELQDVHEARSSDPNIAHEYDQLKYGRLPEFSLTPKEYNRFKRQLKDWHFKIQASY